ncbi:MAG: hypothetical protein QF548_08400, partial [Acidimicrobiales bacterium]|nr:hypothetical protein [Acidimicrobiales bacterium]
MDLDVARRERFVLELAERPRRGIGSELGHPRVGGRHALHDLLAPRDLVADRLHGFVAVGGVHVRELGGEHR